jgi:alkanesulfonate monooxygenase SsuD/methylene tetrahydromethanopterin reductase-like flavin-dependent oxidoreductase (luciferase family)
MKYGITLPNAGLGADLHVLADLAQAAEQSGWDGVFLWDSLEPTHDIAPDPDDVSLADTHDPWIAMAAIASATDRIRFGPMITPVARRRPWKLARECVSIDHLSGGRLSLPVGLGYAPEGGFAKVGEETDIRIRAERLDEGLAILDGLWSGESFSFEGNHFAVKDLRFRPRPLQQPRIPIWVVAGWRSERSLARALRWDGMIPQRLGGEDPLTPAEIAELTSYARAHRAANGQFEVVVEGLTTGRAPSELERVQAYADAGVTWWLEGLWLYIYETPGDAEVIRRWIGAGPPRPTQA